MSAVFGRLCSGRSLATPKVAFAFYPTNVLRAFLTTSVPHYPYYIFYLLPIGLIRMPPTTLFALAGDITNLLFERYLPRTRGRLCNHESCPRPPQSATHNHE